MTREEIVNSMSLQDAIQVFKDTNAYGTMDIAKSVILKALGKMQQWIPVSEGLPEKLQDVLITFYDAEDEYDVAYMRKTFNATYKAQGSENEWVSSMGETTYADYEVSAWMPIEPYKASPTGAESEIQDADCN